MSNIKEAIDVLGTCIAEQFNDGIENVDTCEMGRVADIFKDLLTGYYYCKITDAMETSEYGKDYDVNGELKYYHHRDLDVPKGRMYFSEPMKSKDMREGNAGIMRKTYLESKEMHGNDSNEMDKLEDYMNTLERDLLEVKMKMTEPEKQMAKNKLLKMANTID